MPSRQSRVQKFFLWLWYPPKPSFWVELISYLFLPLAALLQWIARRRRRVLQNKQASLAVPVVVVGNITVGGSGKTPVVIALAAELINRGYKPGIISRGYGGSAAHYPQSVKPGSLVHETGDEALMMAQSVDCPIVVGKDRLAAANLLLQLQPETSIIISDDGLQHYRLPRDYEIVVVDGERGLGNRRGLPAGPLREPEKRMLAADFILSNGMLKQALASTSKRPFNEYSLKPIAWQQVASGQTRPLDEPEFKSTSVSAVAGIGNPKRFFNTLSSLGIEAEIQAFDDHHAYKPEDFSQWQGRTVLMTQKDAVKCQLFAHQNWWWLRVEAQLPDELLNAVVALIK